MKNEVLVVSTDFEYCSIYYNFLETKGFNICFCADLNDAIRQINNRTDLVIMDMDNPIIKKQDLKLIRQFKRRGINKIILIVKEISDNALNECIDFFQISVIKKPFDIEDFFSDVETVLRT